MVSSKPIVTLAHAEVVELCRKLGHDPARVARITIEPHVVIVEYEHPIMGPEPDEITHPLVKSDDTQWRS